MTQFLASAAMAAYMAAAFLVAPFIVFSRWRDGLRDGRTLSFAIIDLMFVAPVIWIPATGGDWDVFGDRESLGLMSEMMEWFLSFISIMLPMAGQLGEESESAGYEPDPGILPSHRRLRATRDGRGDGPGVVEVGVAEPGGAAPLRNVVLACV